MISFDNNTHIYYLDAKPLISCTQLLIKHNLAPDYSKVNKELLEQSAKKGSAVHKEIDEYLRFGIIGITNELQQFIKKNKGNTWLGNEAIVHNDIVAGTYDYLYKNKKGEIVRVDFKTTSTKHLDSVSWQLSIYDYLDDYYKANKFELWHFDKEKGLKIIPIPKKSTLDLDTLMNCERLGIPFKPQELELSKQEIIEIESLQNAIEHANSVIKSANAKLDLLKETIIKKMEENNIKSFKNDTLSITYVAPSTRESIDTTRLNQEHPELIENYKKVSNIKASVRITIKEKE